MAINARAAARKEAEIAFLKAEDELLKELGKKRKREAAEKSAPEKELSELDMGEILEYKYDPMEPIGIGEVLFSEEDREEEKDYPEFGKSFLDILAEDEAKKNKENDLIGAKDYKKLLELENKKTEEVRKNKEKDLPGYRPGESEESKYLLSPTVRASMQRSENMYNVYKSGEEWLMSDEGGDDLVKGFINNFRSAIGTGVEDFAYWLNDVAPWYTPAKKVVEDNMAGEIEEQAQRNFGNAKANGVNGKFVDAMDDLSKGLGYNVFGFKAGNYIQDGADAFGEYRSLRDSGYTKEEATLAMAKKAPMYILSNKADDYIGKNSKVDEVLYGKSGIINDYSDATKKFISKQEDAVHKQMNNLKTDVLNKKLPKNEVKNFEIRIDKRIREITNSGYSQEEMEKYFGDLRKTLSELYNQKTKFLPVKEYAHVMSETATHTPTVKWKNGDFSKPIKNDLYDVDNKGFSEFKITSKKPIY